MIFSKIILKKPDLMIFLKKKIFNKDEIQEIIKERERHEYQLVKKSCTKKEFVSAIQYEYELVFFN